MGTIKDALASTLKTLVLSAIVGSMLVGMSVISYELLTWLL